MLKINQSLCNQCGDCINACPFAALEMEERGPEVTAGCKLCGLCVKACNKQAIELQRSKEPALNKAEHKGVLVYAEQLNGELHPVTLELLGKATELASVCKEEVCCLLLGKQVQALVPKLIAHGAQKIFLYEHPRLEHFRVDVYANVFEDCIKKQKPSVVLVGATSVGRSLAPRVATRFETGLTADCTMLERRANSDLVQIRPAFGGNIMAQILTTNHRPQFATVRPKVMNALPANEASTGQLVKCEVLEQALDSGIEVVEVTKRPPIASITDAEVLVVAGRGVKEKKDMALLEALAQILGGQLACTRPLMENGMLHYTRQIGLSGRTVKPRLLIACGVSGAIQFTAGMNGADTIVAINTDENAPIFQVAHLGFVGDLYEIIPRLLRQLQQEVAL